MIPEANAVANYATQATLLQEENATPQRVIERASDKEALHLGCHGIFDPQQPQESGLMLAGGWLTVQRLIAELRLNACQLVTLGACQSWVLTQAIMTAGAPSVVSSLWSVDDSATRALFEAFYAHIANGHPPANALRQATALIRQQAAWQHPFYWAAFTVNGLAHGPLPSQNDPVRFPIEHVTKQIRTLHRATTRGNPTMNSKRIKIETRTYLKGIAHHQPQLAKALSATQFSALLTQLSTHQQQLATAQSESQLLTACDAIHQLVENTPILRQHLVPPETNVTQTQHARAIKLKHWQNTAKRKEADAKMKAKLDNQMKKVREKLDEALKGMSGEGGGD